MTNFTASFISQIFRRALGLVRTAGAHGDVEIQNRESERAPTSLKFLVSTFLAHCGSNAGVEEAALPTAVTYLHRHPESATAEAVQLERIAHVWIGDFRDPAVEKRYDYRSNGLQSERRSGDDDLHAIVEQAIELRNLHGREAARTFLTASNLSRSAQRRILANGATPRQVRSQPANESLYTFPKRLDKGTT